MPVHLIHVGKCAGESVITTLRPSVRNLVVHHVFDANLKIATRVYQRNPQDIFLVLTRDPLARFVSAFEWDLYHKSVGNAGIEIQRPHWRPVYAAFRTANDLAEALSSPDRERRTMAEWTMRESKLHVALDLGWYVPPVIAAELPTGRSYLIRTERLAQDLAFFQTAFGVPVTAPAISKAGYRAALPPDRLTAALSPLAQRNIELFSHATYASLRVFQSRLAAPDRPVLT
jgi:hypothetical protein